MLEETRDIDADSDGGCESDSSEEESDDDEEDETAELLRELEKIKKERAETREREVYNHLNSIPENIYLRLPTGSRKSCPRAS